MRVYCSPTPSQGVAQELSKCKADVANPLIKTGEALHSTHVGPNLLEEASQG
jgi:hypothetical protein